MTELSLGAEAFLVAALRGRLSPEVATPRDETSAVLLAVGGLLGREVAIEDLLQGLVDGICKVMDADRGTIYLVDQQRHEVFSKAAHLPELDEIRLGLGQGVAGFVAETGEIVNVPTTTNERRFFGGVDEKTGYRTDSILAAPMRSPEGAIIGVVQLLNKRGGPFTREDERRLGALSEQAALAIRATTLYEALKRGGEEKRKPFPLKDRFNLIVGDSDSLREACRLTAKAAASNATVLIRGESGTGKELFARAVHVNSVRRDKTFVKVDCAALPATLIENELFGHERGAFTGADRRTAGKFDLAQGGTIFLDEIGELPLEVQGKLLRVLQDREYERVGGEELLKADVRVVAATNRDLEKMVAEGRFRQDLYYRIKVVEIQLPALRTRGADDIISLARHFVAAAARKNARPVPEISTAAAERLARYSWPGNVRELENCMESAVVIMDGEMIMPEDLPLPSRSTQSVDPHPNPRERRSSGSATEKLAEIERAHIIEVLERVDGNRSLAAKRLGIGRNTLARKLKSYGLD